jgi:gliding motility-associated-like protein
VNSITCACNPELFSLKGKNAIGNEFYIPSQLQWAIDTIRFPSAKAAFDIVATEDNTVITITPAKALIGRPANIPFTINLNKGQSFSCQALYRSGPSLLNGSKVVSDKPIAITTKEDLLFSDGPCADLAGDQLVPTSILGNEFAVVKGNLSVRDKAVVTGTQNNTKVYIDGSGTAAATINSGQSYEIDLNTQPSVYIKTDKVVNVLHYTGEGCEVGSAIIPKLNCTGSSSVSIVRSNAGDAVVLLVTKNGNKGNFLVNGSTGIINAADFSPLLGTGGNYVFCKKSIPGAMPLNTATTFTNTTGKFQLGFINALPGGCMYGYFSDFKKSNVSSSQTEICKSDSAQLNAFGGSVYQWSPGTGLSNTNISNPKASPNTTTDYKVVITDIDGCIDSAFVKVVVNNCTALSCNNWLKTQVVGQSVTVGDLDVSGNQITIEANFNCTSFPISRPDKWEDIVSKHSNTTDANYVLRMDLAAITTTNGHYLTPAPCDNLLLNKTYHVALVYDGNNLKLYRDGFLISQIAATGNLILNNLLTTIGDYAINLPVGTNFLGYINEVRIWNVARTQTELRAYMNTSLPNPTTQAGLKGYYTFDNLLNKQGNTAFNGTLNGGAIINAINPNCNFVADSCNIIVPQETIINDYTPVLSLDPCKNILTVGNAAAYNIGDTVLLIQMKGAVIDSSNTAAFGTVTDYKSTGNYEYNYVKSKAGNQIELKNKILRTYEIPNGKVQLIRVPYYQNYSTTNTLTCLPWDGTIGGVLVFNVNNTLTLNNDIDVSGRGFRGGRAENFNTAATNCNSNNFFYPLGNVLGAAKGEGIADISIAKQSGKGRLANGGGGGNDHNAGGGGGSNSILGGAGGKEYNSCTITGIGNGGVAGFNLNNAGNKIFLGGGGGSGHANDPGINNFTAPGGNGGGIVIINSNILNANGFKIINNGNNANECITGGNCNDGAGGGGSGGSILLDVNTYSSPTPINANGGSGGSTGTLGTFITGPGGGGSGGMVWLKQNSNVTNAITNYIGGINGVNLTQSNNPWGATSGQSGQTLFNLNLPITTILFKPNIDSVKINALSTSCQAFNFNGLGFTNTSPITNWQWHFGDGATATTQNTSHSYATAGTYTVKLIITDNNGCTDSITKPVTANGTAFDFSYKQDVCNPLSVQFFAAGVSLANPHWSFGDGSTSNTVNPIHTYAAPGNYLVRFTINNPCNDTISKTISVNVTPADIIITPDTTICFGATKQLRTQPVLSFCWLPTTYLNNPLLPNPVTSATAPITYYFTAEVPGNNIITNGDFNNGNTGFTSDYNYAASNITEGEYFVGANPQAWNASLSNCTDHTSGNGNMLLVNGSPVANVEVWKQTINVIPNTNYAFSTWIQALYPPNPAQLSFSINGLNVGNLITASLPTCTWKQFYTTWNSGNNTSATISIVNKNTIVLGNDFALDDISFTPVSIKRDSIKITIDTPIIKTIAPVSVCSGIPVQINTSGASVYSWVPPTGLSNPNINNPVATPNTTTKYIVSGTTIHGCIAKDSVTITIFPKPFVTKIPDTTICKNTTVQLFATGGNSYVWSPAATLSNPNIYNPVAAPVAPATTYYVTVINTAVNACSNKDSVNVAIKPDPVFTISPAASICTGATKQLNASGGNVYLWNPASLVNNAAIPNPVATATSSTNYSVTITDSKCNISKTLFTTITVNQLPKVTASKSNDVNCSVPSSRLLAGGASKYTWAPSTGLNDSTVYNPISSPRNTTQYVVTGTDVLGCANKDSIVILVNKLNESGYYIPNTFTPNGDSKNDCFGIKFWGLIDELQFFIYNRYGEKVFYTNDPNQCWDGTFKGQPADQGNYVYYIKAKTLCGNAEKKGSVILLR